MTEPLRVFGPLLQGTGIFMMPVLLLFLPIRALTLRGPKFHRWIVAWIETVCALFSLMALAIVATPGPAPERAWEWLPTVSLTQPSLIDFAGNLVLLIPMGLLLALWRHGIRLAMFMPVTIELTQYVFIPGRVGSLSDIVLGMTGIVLGWQAGHAVRLTLLPPPRRASVDPLPSTEVHSAKDGNGPQLSPPKSWGPRHVHVGQPRRPMQEDSVTELLP